MSDAQDWRAEAYAMSEDRLIDESLWVHDHAIEILEGRVTDSRWNGFGTSLCVRGLVILDIGVERGILKDTGEWRRVQHFLIHAQFLMAALGERVDKPTSAGGKPRMTVKRSFTSSNPFCCKGCANRSFTNLARGQDHWWVCGKCLLPTEQWFRGQGDDVLNKFTGGPLDGMVYASSSLLNDARLTNLVLGYVFTPDVIKSEVTGAVARVWLHAPGQPGSVSLARNTNIGSTADPKRKGNAMSVQETPESVETPTTEAAAPVEPVKTDDLLATRTRLGLSRTPVSQAAGVSVAQLARIEKGGNRTTAAEAEQVRAALAKLEAEAPAPAAEATEAASDPS